MTSLSEKMAKITKLYKNENNSSSKLSLKLKFGQVIENYISSEIFTQRFVDLSIFENYAVFVQNLAIFKKFWSNFERKQKNSQNTQIIKKTPCSDFR